MFAGKARAYPSEDPYSCSTRGWAPGLAKKATAYPSEALFSCSCPCPKTLDEPEKASSEQMFQLIRNISLLLPYKFDNLGVIHKTS
jgi:hypothetical protein